MKIADIKQNAFSMPLTSPAYPRGPYKFVDREFLIITYETDMDVLREVVPEPLIVVKPIVKYELIRMPDSTGFGDHHRAYPDQFANAVGKRYRKQPVDFLSQFAQLAQEFLVPPAEHYQGYFRAELQDSAGDFDHRSARKLRTSAEGDDLLVSGQSPVGKDSVSIGLPEPFWMNWHAADGNGVAIDSPPREFFETCIRRQEPPLDASCKPETVLVVVRNRYELRRSELTPGGHV